MVTDFNPDKQIRGKAYPTIVILIDDLIAYRWGDLLLLRAEANAALNKISESLVDLNEVRDRAGGAL